MLNIGGKLRLILKSNIDKHDLIAITDKNSGIHIRTYNVVQTQKVVVLMPSLSPLCVLPVNLTNLDAAILSHLIVVLGSVHETFAVLINRT